MPRGQLDPHRRYRVIPLELHDALTADRANGLSVPTIAAKYGFKPSAVQNFLYTHGVKPPSKIGRKPRKDIAIPPEEWARIAARYQAGEKAAHLAQEYGVAPSVLSRIFRKTNVPLVMGDPPKLDAVHDEEIVRLRRSGMDLQELAVRYGVSVRTIEERLRRKGCLAGEMDEMAWRKRTMARQQLRQGRSKLEVRVGDILQKIGVAFTAQKMIRTPGHRFFVDFLLTNKLVLEVNGSFWHCDSRLYPDGPTYDIQVRTRKRDAAKLEALAQAGYQVAILWEKDFEERGADAVKAVLADVSYDILPLWRGMG